MIENPERIKGVNIDQGVKTPVIRIGCENCLAGDSVMCYEEDVQDRDFHQGYFECDSCRRVLCSNCVDKELRCDVCDNDGFFRLRPLHLYVCGLCIDEGERVCPACRYGELDQSVLFSD